MRAIAVLTSGGDAPGMNSCIRAVVRTTSYHGLGVKGVRRGFDGLIKGDLFDMGPRDVGGIIQKGGTILQTARSAEFVTPAGQQSALDHLRAHGVDGLVVIGGDGSMRGALALHGHGLPVVGVPASIDNDIWGTAMSIGVDTALNTIIEAIDKLRDTASSHGRAFLVETMGRHCGYLALTSGIIGGAEVILVPERDMALQEIAEAMGDAYARGKTHAIMMIAEGAKYKTTEIASYLEDLHVGFQTRITILGHLQRGGRPSAFDRLLATRFGAAAVQALLHGESGVMVGLHAGEIRTISIADVTSHPHEPNFEYYDLAAELAK